MKLFGLKHKIKKVILNFVQFGKGLYKSTTKIVKSIALWIIKSLQFFFNWIKEILNKLRRQIFSITNSISNFFIKILNKIQLLRKRIISLWKKIPYAWQDFIDYAKLEKSWWIYLLIVFISYSLCLNIIQSKIFILLGFSLYDSLDFKINHELASNILTSGLSLIATIFSIAFVIVGFLISSLKSYQEDTYDMIYKNIRLFPTLYISLTIIGSLVLFSLLRDSLNCATFVNLVVWGTFLILINLFIIGSLFVKVIAHIKPSYVYHYYFIELKKVSDRLNGGFKINKNKRKLEEMKVSLDERLSNASSNGEIDNLSHILSVIEEITKLKSK